MRRVLLGCVVCGAVAAVGCGNETKVTNVGPPVDTGGGKGLPAMKPPGEPGGSDGTVPKPPGTR